MKIYDPSIRYDEGMAFMLRYENVAWYEDGKVRILDRRIYPVRTEFVVCTRHEDVAQAIADMVTQSGGPYVAAAMGMALAAYEVRDKSEKEVLEHLEKAAYTLSHARPTTMAKMMKVTERALNVARKALAEGKAGNALIDALKANAVDQVNSGYFRHSKMAVHLADQIPMGGTVMTQCFAETIIGCLLKECRSRGNEIKMICPETRPYFQGARLTASVPCDMGFDVTVISDNMPAYTMKTKKVDLFTSAADVITVDGHIVNKVGTLQIAIAAQYNGVPYFVTGSPNPAHPDMSNVKIEQRDPALVMESMGTKITMDGVKGYYPAFDECPPKLCNGVVTDLGIYSPYNLKQYFIDKEKEEELEKAEKAKLG